MTRALVVAPQWIGDAVMAEPLLATLAERGERLTVAALPWVAPVFRAMPEVAETIDLPFAHGRLDWAARRRIAATLRGRFDVAYVLPNSIKSALVPWLARVPLRVGYRGEGRFLLLNRRLANPGGRPPMVAFYGALAGDSFATGRRPRLHLGDDVLAATAAAHGLQQRRYWTFAPGAEYGPAKRWPAAHYAALARSLHGADGTPVALLGSPGEAALCAEIAAQAGEACRVLAGRTSLLDAMALIAGVARPGEQRLRPDARRRGVRRAAGRRLRLDQPDAHAAAQRARARPLAQGRAAARLHAVLRPHLPLRPLPLPDKRHPRTRRVSAPANGKRQRGDNVAHPLPEGLGDPGGRGWGGSNPDPATPGSSRYSVNFPA